MKSDLLQVEMTDEALLALIENYCREAGVRNLQKQIEKIYRKVLGISFFFRPILVKPLVSGKQTVIELVFTISCSLKYAGAWCGMADCSTTCEAGCNS